MYTICMGYSDPEAQKRYQKDWYQAEKARLLDKQRKKRNAIKAYIQEYKAEHNICTDCKGEFPGHILEFDHLRDKSFQLASAWKHTVSVERVKEEIDKCEIVCSNCHKHRTWLRSVKATQVPVKD